MLDLSLDWRVLAFTIAVTGVTAVLFGTAPAFRATRVAPIDALKEQVAGHWVTRARLASGLVVAQVALSMVLIVAAGLWWGRSNGSRRCRLGSIATAYHGQRGRQRASIDPSNRIPFYHQLVAAVAAVPGVARAGGSMAPPIGGGAGLDFRPARCAAPQPEAGPVPFWNSRMTMLNQITPGWLATYGTAVLAGRDNRRGIRREHFRSRWSTEAYARKFLPKRNPIGETVAFAHGGPPRTIVGVVSDVFTYPCVMACGRLSTCLAQRDLEGRRPMSTSAFVRPWGRPPRWHLVWRLH